MVSNGGLPTRSSAGASRILMAASLVLALLSGARPARAADPVYDAGVQCYAKKDYRRAEAYFGQAIRRNPSDANAFYYHGLTQQALGNTKGAVQDYAIILARFPSAPASANAAAALKSLDPSYLRQLIKSTASGSSSGGGGLSSNSRATTRTYGGGGGGDEAGLPDTATVIFTNRGADDPLMVVPVSVNGRTTSMIFDTGANGVSVGKNTLKELGLPEPQGAPTGYASGVGSGGRMGTWQMDAVVSVGQISRHIPISVQEQMDLPLLGQNFFNAFNYKIDGASHTIRLRKKSTGAEGGNYGAADTVKFERDPQNPLHHIVWVEVNGRPMKMFFDTGAQGVVMTTDQARSIGLTIPDDAVSEVHNGIAGSTEGFGFPVHSIKLGPIMKTDFNISVIKTAGMPFPLLGQSFFHDYSVNIDEKRGVIIFTR